jgi:hypothetical protein
MQLVDINPSTIVKAIREAIRSMKGYQWQMDNRFISLEAPADSHNTTGYVTVPENEIWHVDMFTVRMSSNATLGAIPGVRLTPSHDPFGTGEYYLGNKTTVGSNKYKLFLRDWILYPGDMVRGTANGVAPATVVLTIRFRRIKK